MRRTGRRKPGPAGSLGKPITPDPKNPQALLSLHALAVKRRRQAYAKVIARPTRFIARPGRLGESRSGERLTTDGQTGGLSRDVFGTD